MSHPTRKGAENLPDGDGLWGATMSVLLAQFLNTFMLTALLIAWLGRVAPQFGLVDAPDYRKHHDGKVPLCGGIAIFLAWSIVGYGLSKHFPVPASLLFGLGLLVLIGIADDRWRLTPWPRLATEALAALILVHAANIATINLGIGQPLELTGPAYMAAIAITVVFVVGTMNAMNMLDGIDGLAGASASGALFWLSLMASHAGKPGLAVHILLLLAATIGFLVFNMRHRWRSKATVFLGEAGSITLGGALAYFVISLASGRDGLPLPVLLWIVIVPVTDTASLIVRRLLAHRNPFSPDRWHMHHLLLQTGFSPAAAAGLIAGASTLCGAIGYLAIALDLPAPLMIAGLAVPVIAHTVIVLTISQRRMSKESAGGKLARRMPSMAGGPTGGSA